MRILYVTNSMEMGGIETNLVGLSERLCAQGHDVTVMSAGGALVADLERVGARHFVAPITLRRPAALARAGLALPRLIARARIDVVHSMSAAGNVVTLASSRSGRTAFLSSPMGLQNSDRERRFTTTARNLAMVLRAERVLVISAEIRRALEALPGPRDRLIDQAVVGVDVDRFLGIDREAARHGLGVEPHERLVTTIGALHPRKSHSLFIEAATILRERDQNVRFMIVGDGPQGPQLAEQIRRSGVDDVVTLLGARRDIPQILAATDIYVKPGVVEGFIGITVLEAMACGRPVVAFDTADVHAAIDPGRTGLLVPPGESAALASSIEQLLADPLTAGSMALAGHERVRRSFDLGAVADGLIATYAEILGLKHAVRAR